MCSLCKDYIKTHSQEEVQKNKENYNTLLKELNNTKEEEKFYIYYIEANESFSVFNFINNLITPHKFSSYTEKKKHPITNIEYLTRKLDGVSFYDTDKIVDLLEKHKIAYWVDES